MIADRIIAVMMFFLLLAAADRAFLHDRMGLGPELERGLAAMGPLTLAMAGIMCAAPVLGQMLLQVSGPLLSALRCDPGLIGGMVFSIDMGGFPLVHQMAASEEMTLLSGVLLSSTMGCTMTFTIPVALGLLRGDAQRAAARGIVAALAASPLSAVAGGMAAGLDVYHIVRAIYPAILLALMLTFLLLKHTERMIAFSLRFSRWISGFAVLSLSVGIVEQLLHVTLIPGMVPLADQMAIVANIGITLAGAYPMVYCFRRIGGPVLRRLAGLLRIDEASACGMLVNLANPMPMFAMTPEMNLRGITLAFAFGSNSLALLGDHLGYISSVYAKGTGPMLAGKVVSAAAGLAIALYMERGK